MNKSELPILTAALTMLILVLCGLLGQQRVQLRAALAERDQLRSISAQLTSSINDLLESNTQQHLAAERLIRDSQARDSEAEDLRAQTEKFIAVSSELRARYVKLQQRCGALPTGEIPTLGSSSTIVFAPITPTITESEINHDSNTDALRVRREP